MMHPIVEQMAPSAEQARCIVARGRDVVVTAGAGAGKTRALVARYLALLAEGVPLRGIAAITFTRKAAQEMRNRIRREMRRYLEREDISVGERDRWQALYAGLDSARIGTIHTLCSDILRGHPAEAGIDPRFDVLEEGRSALLRAQAVEEAMGWAANEADVAVLFALLGEHGVQRALSDMLNRRQEAEHALAALPDDILAHWSDALEGYQRQALARIDADPAWQSAADVVLQTEPLNLNDRLVAHWAAARYALAAAGEPPAERLIALSTLAGIKINVGSEKAWPGGTREIKDALRDLRTLWGERLAPLAGGLTARDEALAAALPALAALYRYTAERYATLKDDLNALDFDDLEGRAVALLRENREVRHRWQQEISAVLVDEFQDTNGRQRDLLDMLNGNAGRLFVVGDAKQSIYRFRGADVTVFRQIRRDVQATGGDLFTLATTYRAHAPLVQGLNDLLRPVLGSDEDPARPWAEPFAPLRPYRPEPAAGLAAPYVELHLANGSKSDGAMAVAADALVARLVELVERQGVRIADGEGTRPMGYGDVTIVCRASTSFGAYEDALEQAGVPFLTVAGRGFYHRPEVRDLLNILRAVADPADDLALAGALRSPALAVSDEALFHLGRARHTHSVSLWQAPEHATDVSDADCRALARARDILGALHRRAGRATVADVLKAFLDETDYRAILLRRGQTRAARNVDKLLGDARAGGMVSVGEFLEYVGRLRDSGAREGEARAAGEGAVQIMSVHAAKGLEFPVLVIGDITYSPPHRDRLILDPALGPLLPCKDEDDERALIYTLARMAEDDREATEEDRLLYVAATRAGEALILSGCADGGRDGALGGKLRGWLKRLGADDCLGLAGLTCATEGDAVTYSLCVGETPVTCALYGPAYRGATSAAVVESTPTPAGEAFRPPALLDMDLPAADGEPAAGYGEPAAAPDEPNTLDRVPMRRVWRVVPPERQRRAPRWVIGEVVHRALAEWRFPDETFDAWAHTVAREQGLVDRRQVEHAARMARAILERFRRHPLYGEIDAAAERHHEVPYSLVRADGDGEVENGAMDVLYRRDDGWTVVEFKTDRLRKNDDLGDLLRREDYLAQMGRYTAAVEALLGERPRLLLCMLDDPQHGVRVEENPERLLEGGDRAMTLSSGKESR